MSEFLKSINEMLINEPYAHIGRTIYFDETNNIRRGTINNCRTNNHDLENMYFVLGGIAPKSKINFEELIKYVGAKQIPSDAKFKFFSCKKTSFEDSVSEIRLSKFFEYLLLNNVYIHFDAVHYFYFSLIDIFDSLIDEEDLNQEIVFHHLYQLKSDLMEVLYCDIDSLISLLYEYSYPNIKKGKSNDFIIELLDLYSSNCDKYYDQGDVDFFSKEFLRQIIKSKRDKNNLKFLENNKDFVISEKVDYVYKCRIAEFREDIKIFDIESIVMKQLNFDENDVVKFKFNFCDSKKFREIQLSDVVVGFVGRFFNFISHNDIAALSIWIFQKYGKKDSDCSIKTLKFFFDLMSISDNKNSIFFKRILPTYLNKRFLFLMSEIEKICID